MDGARHEVILGSVQRQLEQLLDESAGEIGDRELLYRVSLHESKSAVQQTLRALGRLRP